MNLKFKNAFTLHNQGKLNQAKDACLEITTGDDNTCLGYRAGINITTGLDNTMIGASTGTTCDSGERNICIGPAARIQYADTDEAIVIGYNLVGEGSRLSFGKASNIVYNTYTSNASWTRSSDERKKTSIADATLGLDFINDLRSLVY